ncbi:hypothetical protein ACLOAV_008186 [Pseudogymnoascus australis]
MEGKLELSFVREQLAIYDGAIAGGYPLPASFTARFEPDTRKRSLGSFLHDEPTYNQEMMLDYVIRLRAYETERLMAFRDRFRQLNQRRLFVGNIKLCVAQARRELDVADSVKEAAQSTALPRGC